MIALHRNNSQQMTPPLLSNASRLAEDSARSTIVHESENASRHTDSNRLNWEMLVIWGFVVLSFAALIFCIFILFAKCHSD